MSDSVPITPGTGADIAVDDIGGLKFQRVKLIHGADGVNDGDVSRANPLPVLADFSVPENLLRQLVQSAASPAGFDRSLGRARVTAVLESGTVTTVSTVTTVTTVSTVTGLTNIDGRPGAMLINQTNLSAWADCVRARIT